MKATTLGALLVIIYTGMMAGADGITKFIAGGYEAPQLFALSAALVVLMAAGATRVSKGETLRIHSVKPMIARSVLTVIAAVAFFKAFMLLPFADVFLFIGLMPLIAAAMSGPMLGETPRPLAWVALGIGACGVFFLMPGGISGMQAGHFWAFAAAITGTASMLLARVIAQVERAPLAQVFWPNLALLIAMGAALPFVWRPMSFADAGWIVGYAVFLFGARYVVAEALRLLPAYVATPLMNLQFVWMVAIGMVAFGEIPGTGTVLGVMLVIASGLWLVIEESLQRKKIDAQQANSAAIAAE
ncbi:EamA-like transporter family protein [Pelagimonas phthalicica]|uniref:EamA-like transporter family protein n=1 Tax=Pelagimonas phthalicica TaxID=1037362 RepID=A0A238JD92_9RHOB|nr:DMT family transporter [Pelagimonas phthalicica]TDS91070.1 S-adenosylmethionine uptake transporter [Pelagimonas phthalicica]SMX28117.1 EamA-like transporter family protein [Pelagimonas phthalicica]